MQPEFHSGAVTRPLSAILQLAMMGCPALRARGELAAGACAPVLGWDRGGSSFAGARAWWGACGTGARGPLRGVFGRLPLAWLRLLVLLAVHRVVIATSWSLRLGGSTSLKTELVCSISVVVPSVVSVVHVFSVLCRRQ